MKWKLLLICLIKLRVLGQPDRIGRRPGWMPYAGAVQPSLWSDVARLFDIIATIKRGPLPNE